MTEIQINSVSWSTGGGLWRDGGGGSGDTFGAVMVLVTVAIVEWWC